MNDSNDIHNYSIYEQISVSFFVPNNKLFMKTIHIYETLIL